MISIFLLWLIDSGFLGNGNEITGKFSENLKRELGLWLTA